MSTGGAIFQRCDIWWARVEPKARPVVLVSRDSHLRSRDLVVVVPVTTRVRGLPTELPLGQEDGLLRPCVADAGTLCTIRTALLDKHLASLAPSKRRLLDAALRYALGLD